MGCGMSNLSVCRTAPEPFEVQRNDWLVVLSKKDPLFGSNQCPMPFLPPTKHKIDRLRELLSGHVHIVIEGEDCCWEGCGCVRRTAIRYGPQLQEERDMLYKLLPSHSVYYYAQDVDEKARMAELEELIFMFGKMGARQVTARLLKGKMCSSNADVHARLQGGQGLPGLNLQLQNEDRARDNLDVAFSVTFSAPPSDRPRSLADLTPLFEQTHYLHNNQEWQRKMMGAFGQVDNFEFHYKSSRNKVQRMKIEAALEVPGMASAGAGLMRSQETSDELEVKFEVAFFPWQRGERCLPPLAR